MAVGGRRREVAFGVGTHGAGCPETLGLAQFLGAQRLHRTWDRSDLRTARTLGRWAPGTRSSPEITTA